MGTGKRGRCGWIGERERRRPQPGSTIIPVLGGGGTGGALACLCGPHGHARSTCHFRLVGLAGGGTRASLWRGAARRNLRGAEEGTRCAAQGGMASAAGGRHWTGAQRRSGVSCKLRYHTVPGWGRNGSDSRGAGSDVLPRAGWRVTWARVRRATAAPHRVGYSGRRGWEVSKGKRGMQCGVFSQQRLSRL